MLPEARSTAPVFHEGVVELVLDLRAYRLGAIQKTAYRLAARCTAVLGNISENFAEVRLMFPSPTPEAQALEVARVFFQELLDQELREQIALETAPLRNLILAHAYSRTGLPSDGRK
ncbi:MAG: His-Xaa-Ser system protein HxsD [Minicystis sp.]